MRKHGRFMTVVRLNDRLTTIATLLLVLQLVPASAQAAGGFPAAAIDSQTMQVQAKAEEVFERGNYERAYFIYREELAPIGDKYSQYMVGFMYLTGKGVDEDKVTASAWYRLAAERGTPEFVRVRDEVMMGLTPEQRAYSDRKFIELRKQFGDLALLMRAVRADYDALKMRTGSRVASDSSPLTVLDPRHPGTTVSGSEYYGRIEKRLQERLRFIVNYTQIDIVDMDDVDALNLAALEEKVNHHLDTLP
jgi:hypothetical protein